jgi:predicted nucleic acid-binding protein
MICYLDTSAFVPLLLNEPSSANCLEVWSNADAVVTSHLAYVEAAAALAQAARMNRLSTELHYAAIYELDRLWPDFQVVDVSERTVFRAAQIATTCGLRGYDAVHCASAELVNDHDLIFASGDKRLIQACGDLGIATANVNDLDH